MTKEERDFTSEFTFKSSRSGGKGGQHVNKTESRQSLFFDLEQSQLLSVNEKQLLRKKWQNRLSQEDVLQIDVEESRSQLQNKKIAIQKFYDLLKEGLHRPKKRKITKPSKAAIRRKIKKKKQKAEKKQRRRDDNVL